MGFGGACLVSHRAPTVRKILNSVMPQFFSRPGNCVFETTGFESLGSPCLAFRHFRMLQTKVFVFMGINMANV